MEDPSLVTVAQGSFLEKEIDVFSGRCYLWRIEDAYGDSICCNHGYGSYKLTWIILGYGFVNEEHIIAEQVGTYGDGETFHICDPGIVEECISIDIFEDAYPEDITWELIDPLGNVVSDGIYQGLGCYRYRNDTCYRVRVMDSYGDGLCCGYGSGGFKVSWGTTNLFQTGIYYDGHTVFDGNLLDVKICDPDPSPEFNCLSLDLISDNYPEDITWSLYTEYLEFLLEGDSRGFPCFSGDDDRPLDGSCYVIKINDAYGDGLCCDWGYGSFSVSWSNHQESVVI
eukprot:UN32727